MKQYKVYFIKQVNRKKRNTPMKVGYSHDPDARLKDLQTGNPNKLKLCFSIPCNTKKDAVIFERTLHLLIAKKYRSLVGEWFLIYGDIVKLIYEAQKICRKKGVQIENIKSIPNKENKLIEYLRNEIKERDKTIQSLEQIIELNEKYFSSI